MTASSFRTFAAILVTGTDTHVGKTWFSCLLIRWLTEAGVRCGAYKPACSGALPGDGGQPNWGQPNWGDIEAIYEALGHQFPRDLIGPQCFLAPLAPPVAARLEGRVVDFALLGTGLDRWTGKADAVVVEGAGGLLCPLTEQHSIADFAKSQALPLVVVARGGLGTINHTLLTLESAQQRGLIVTGFVVNQLPGEDQALMYANAAEISRRTPIPLLGCLTTGARELRDVNGQTIQFDWKSLLIEKPAAKGIQTSGSQPEST